MPGLRQAGYQITKRENDDPQSPPATETARNYGAAATHALNISRQTATAVNPEAWLVSLATQECRNIQVFHILVFRRNMSSALGDSR